MNTIKKKAFLGLSFIALGASLSLAVSADSGILTESMVDHTRFAAKASYHSPVQSYELVPTEGPDNWETLDFNKSKPIHTALNPQAAADYANLQAQGYKGFITFDGIYGRGTKEQAGFVAFRSHLDGTADILVAYHGTYSGADAYTDICCGKVGLAFGKGEGHSGFVSAYMSGASAMKQAIAQIMQENGFTPEATRITATGHSMGGALATLAAYDLANSEEGYRVGAVTYGSPRVLDRVAAQDYENKIGESSARVWRADDIVPASNLGALGFKHVGKEVVLSPKGETLEAHGMRGYAQETDAAAVVNHVKKVVSHQAHRAEFNQNLADLKLDAATEKKMRDAYTTMYADEEKATEKKRAQSFSHGLKNAAVTLGGVVKSTVASGVKSLVRSIGSWFSRG